MKILKIFLKILSGTLLITIFNYATTMVASRELEVAIFASIALIQYSLNIILRISSVGINYEILRYGNERKYQESKYNVNLNRILLGCSLIIITGLLAIGFVDGLYHSWSSYLIIPMGIFIYLTSILASVLRSLESYITSNILDKAWVIAIASIYLFTLYDGAFFDIVYYLLFGLSFLAFSIATVLLSRKIQLKSVFKWNTIKIKGNISNQMFVADIMFLTATSIDKLFINQSLSLEQLGIWVIYYQLFIPFQFVGRLLYQVFFPEMSHDRFKLTIPKALLFVGVIVFGCIAIYFPIEYFYTQFYESTLKISGLAIALMIAMGGIYVLGVPSGLYLAAKLDSKSVFYNNIASGILSALLVVAYALLAPISFPYLMMIAICSYWLLKIIATLSIIYHDKRNSNN